MRCSGTIEVTINYGDIARLRDTRDREVAHPRWAVRRTVVMVLLTGSGHLVRIFDHFATLRRILWQLGGLLSDVHDRPNFRQVVLSCHNNAVIVDQLTVIVLPTGADAAVGDIEQTRVGLLHFTDCRLMIIDLRNLQRSIH